MSKSNSMGTTLTVNGKAVGSIRTINGIDINAEKIDVTNLSTTGGYKEYLPGAKDVADMTLTGFMDGADDGQAELHTLLNSGATVACSITFPAAIGKTWSFQASVIRFATTADVSNAITFEAALAVTGQPTLAATPSGGGNT